MYDSEIFDFKTDRKQQNMYELCASSIWKQAETLFWIEK